MRIKTVPRHRILQRNARVASATETSIDAETVTDTKKNCDSTHTMNSQNLYNQAYESPSAILIPGAMSSTSCSDLTLPTSTSVSSPLANNNNNNSEVVNLSIKDASNRVNKTASGNSAEPDDKLKDTFLYKIMTDPNFLENIQRNKQPKKFVCIFCKEDFTTCEELTSHMDVKKNDSNQIACCACKKTFAEKRYLKYHRRCHSERTKFTCDICTRKYTRLDNLTRHNVLHVNPDKFSCTICNRTFTRKDLLNKHRKSHEKYNLYCEKCGKYFRKILTLENHQKTHGDTSNISTSAAAFETEASVKNIDCKTENTVCAENTVCKTDISARDEDLVCKTEESARKTQNLPFDESIC
ncbi:RB-associated KRAB zinc finger protein-like [Odontomachus brunneus]|uniref:RB-associated KRAB zinc finger protein-like n=1 Tax=Odontomachus brunneus TaxID=486640 RepID=UPI0013F1B53A|nr:RB-associated KRAB zinc finger protein-like [Odontomachus brunneus]XP_032682874.1 RB-associated KRAB zinc finger protein-like [Odontomachus brunneus]